MPRTGTLAVVGFDEVDRRLAAGLFAAPWAARLAALRAPLLRAHGA